MHTRTFATIAALCCCAGLAAPARVKAQSSPTQSIHAQPTTAFCFSSTSLPSCGSYLVFEMTGGFRLTGTTRLYSTNPAYAACGPGCRINDLPSYLAWDIGWMKNRSSNSAVGASLQVGGSEDGARLALRARSRFFLPHNGVFDVAAGPLAVRIGNTAEPREAYGATGDVALGIRRVGTAFVGADVTNDRSRIAAALHGGVRLESWPAVAGTALATAGAIMTAVALSRGFE